MLTAVSVHLYSVHVNRSERNRALKRRATQLLKPAAFLAFTGYVVDVVVRATGPAIDTIAFDVAATRGQA